MKAWRFLRHLDRAQWAWLLCAVSFVGLPWSRFLTTAGVMLLGGFTLLEWKKDQTWPTFRKDIFVAIGSGWREAPWFLFGLFFLPTLLSGFWSEDLGYWLTKLRLRLPYFAIPIMFMTLPKWTEAQFYKLLYVLFLASLISGLLVMLRYGMNFEAVNLDIGRGHAIKTPIGHIRFSLVLCMGFFFGLAVFQRKITLSGAPLERGILALGLVVLFAIIHVLAVRSGWLVLYAGLLMFCVYGILVARQWRFAFFFLPTVLFLPLIMYKTVPSVRTKIGYSLWDYKMHQNGQGDSYSDSDRWCSIKAGKAVAMAHPFFGVGAGDARLATQTKFEELFPSRTLRLEPHNGFVYTWAATGFFGVLTMIYGFFVAFWRYRRHWLIGVQTLAIVLSCLFEPTLENSTGVYLHAWLLAILMFGTEIQKNAESQKK